jgi:hypothetical protein
MANPVGAGQKKVGQSANNRQLHSYNHTRNNKQHQTQLARDERRCVRHRRITSESEPRANPNRKRVRILVQNCRPVNLKVPTDLRAPRGRLYTGLNGKQAVDYSAYDA